MRSSDYASLILAEWAEEECRHFDLIASWENLISVYQALGFIGPPDDERRLEEFKVVITEMNKFLTRMKNGLDKTSSIDDAIEFLGKHVNSDMGIIKTRPNIAYNKLKQRWIGSSIAALSTAVEIIEGERDAE